MRYFAFLPFLATIVVQTSMASAQPSDTAVLKSVPDEYIAGAVARPARVLESKVVTTIVKSLGEADQLAKSLDTAQQSIGIDPREIEEVAVLLDRKTILSLAGMPDVENPDAFDTSGMKNQLKQVGLAMHNFHATFNEFPDHDGRDSPNKGNLSWRVWLLPFVGEAKLYNQFHQDEPWDSEHNKTLIDQMPEIFQIPGVKDKTKTSLHGIVGDGTIMSGDLATSFRDITDGTSNTIMFAVAGPDKAEIWTKPGGVKLEKGGPRETLGKIGETFFMARCDGSVAALSSDMKVNVFQALVSRSGGEVIPRDLDKPSKLKRLPTFIVRSRSDIDRKAVLDSLKPLGEAKETKVGSTTVYAIGEYGVAFPDSRQLIAAPSDLLPKLLSKSATSEFAEVLAKQSSANDFAAMVDFTRMKGIKDKLLSNLPMVGLVQAVESLRLTVDVAGSDKNLIRLTANTSNEPAAANLSAMLSGMVEMQKAQMRAMANGDLPGQPPFALLLFQKFGDNVEVKADGKDLMFQITKPDDTDAVLEELKPVLVDVQKSIKQARAAADRVRRINSLSSLKNVGLALHNYHDAHSSFPRYNGDANPVSDKANRGLSWRVHLLPFIGEANLYDQFNRNEPWDSETNKKLIEQMPDVFQTEGVEKPSHTAMHVFIGEDTAFGDGTDAPQLRDYRDGTSNTILVVEAGPDTAEIWTKPGGLKFTGENTIELMGKIGESFQILVCDGSARTLSKGIDENLLNNLIQHNDGNPIGNF